MAPRTRATTDPAAADPAAATPAPPAGAGPAAPADPAAATTPPPADPAAPAPAPVDAAALAGLAALDVEIDELDASDGPSLPWRVLSDFTGSLDGQFCTFKAGTVLDPLAGARLAEAGAPVEQIED